MIARRWLASGILAVFTLLPALQLQCEIACASDDVANTPAVAADRDSGVGITLALATPDDCAGRATPSPMLPGTVHRPVLISPITSALPDLRHSGLHAVAPPRFDDARRRGSTGLGTPLRI